MLKDALLLQSTERCILPYTLGFLAGCLYQSKTNHLDLKKNSSELVNSRGREPMGGLVYKDLAANDKCFGIYFSVRIFHNGLVNNNNKKLLSRTLFSGSG